MLWAPATLLRCDNAVFEKGCPAFRPTRHNMIWFLLAIVLSSSCQLSMADDETPVPFNEQSIVQDESERSLKLFSSPTFGKVRKAQEGIRPISTLSHAKSAFPVSECHWGTYRSVLFLGPAPKVCRRGKRLDGSHDRGWALLQIMRSDNVATSVHYPRNLANTNGDRQTEQVGPFSMCAPVAADRGIYACKAEEYTAVEIYRNTSAVWIQDTLIVGQSTFFQFMGIVQSIVFAMLAGAPKLRPSMFQAKRTPLLLKAAADAATGGVVTMALLFARGRSIVGLDLELGHTRAALGEIAIVAWSASLAVNAWMQGWATSVFSKYPLYTVTREFCEIPILISLVVIWPMVSGPNFIIQLQFLCGLAISYVGGRASGILNFGPEKDNSYARIAAAFTLLGSISVGSLLCIPAASQTGAIIRGSVAVAFSATLQIHAAGAAFIFAAPARIAFTDAPVPKLASNAARHM